MGEKVEEKKSDIEFNPFKSSVVKDDEKEIS
jgi:hypothetical protein